MSSKMLIHEFHPPNPSGRDFAVGDLHGNRDELMRSLAAVAFDRGSDRLFSAGDLIDRGPDSLGLLRLTRQSWFYAVRGNHEDLLQQRFQAADDDTQKFATAMHIVNGGMWFEKLALDERLEALALIEALPLARTIRTHRGQAIGIVHAAWHRSWQVLQKADAISAEDYEKALWLRHGDPNIQQQVAGVDLVISGHQCDQQPVRRGNQLWIDTLHRGGKLTLVELETAPDAFASPATDITRD